ncbi:hypothetical protein ACIQWI_11970 [Peribacillus frigoritolerans]
MPSYMKFLQMDAQCTIPLLIPMSENASIIAAPIVAQFLEQLAVKVSFLERS